MISAEIINNNLHKFIITFEKILQTLEDKILNIDICVRCPLDTNSLDRKLQLLQIFLNDYINVIVCRKEPQLLYMQNLFKVLYKHNFWGRFGNVVAYQICQIDTIRRSYVYLRNRLDVKHIMINNLRPRRQQRNH